MGKMKHPMSKTYTNVAEIGNTADASLAIALCDAVNAGLVQRGFVVKIQMCRRGADFDCAEAALANERQAIKDAPVVKAAG